MENKDKCFCHFNGYEVKDAKARISIAELTGKKVVVFGDSIAKGDHSNGGVFAKLPDDFDVTISNYAVNGAYMVDGVTNNLSDQYNNMINDNINPDIIIFMFHFNEISNANSLMTTKNSIGFPQNDDRETSIGNLEYWIKYTLEHYPDCKMCYINYPIKIAQNPRSFFNAQFEYALYLLGEIYGMPICNMKNSGMVFDENADNFTSDGLHFNANGVEKIMYPFIKDFLLSGMSVRNEEPPHCIGLYGEQATAENYVIALSKLENIYGKKDFARTFDGLYFYTKEDTTDTTVRFGHLTNNFNQLYGSFGVYWGSNSTSFTRYNYYGGNYSELDIVKTFTYVNGNKTNNLVSGAASIESDGGNLKITTSFEVATTVETETIGTKTCLKLFTFASNNAFKNIPVNTLKKVGGVCIGTFSGNQPIHYGLGLLVNEDYSAALYVVGGEGNYPSMKNGGCNIFTCKSLVSY